MLLKLIIKFYWFLIPARKRNTCLFKVSCSNHVYNATKHSGLSSGLIELWKRFNTCTPNHEIFFLDENIAIRLSDGTILHEEEISEDIVQKHKYILNS